MKLERILLKMALIGISFPSLYSCEDKESRSSEDKIGNITDVMTTDDAGLRDDYDTKSAYETNITNTDQLTDKNNFALDSHLGEEDYNLQDTLKSDSPDLSPYSSYRNTLDSNFYADEVDSLQKTVEVLACIDEDGDGYGLNCILGSDCDDYNLLVHQALICGYDGNSCGEYRLCIDVCPELHSEKCDGIDNNCNGETDEGYDVDEVCTIIFENNLDSCSSKGQLKCLNDSSGTYCDAENTFSLCPNQNGVCSGMGYCTNYKYFVDPCEPPEYPNEESCDGLDNNCNGLVDDIFLENSDYCKKQGVCSKGPVLTLCEEGKWLCSYEFVPYYENEELSCDNIDNDCDGQTDGGLKKIFYGDSDGDGFGNSNKTIEDCIMPEGYADNNLDCDDDNPFVHEDCE